MLRAAALIGVVLVAIFQKGDAPPVVRAALCLNKECSKTSLIGYEPAQIRVSYSVPIHADNRAVAFGILCTSGEEHAALWQLDGERERIPQWIVMYRNVSAGECIAGAVVQRADGSEVRGQSGKVLIQESR